MHTTLNQTLILSIFTKTSQNCRCVLLEYHEVSAFEPTGIVVVKAAHETSGFMFVTVNKVFFTEMIITMNNRLCGGYL